MLNQARVTSYVRTGPTRICCSSTSLLALRSVHACCARWCNLTSLPQGRLHEVGDRYKNCSSSTWRRTVMVSHYYFVSTFPTAVASALIGFVPPSETEFDRGSTPAIGVILVCVVLWYPNRPFFANSIKTTILHRFWRNCNEWQWMGRDPTLEVAGRTVSVHVTSIES